MIVLVLNCGSSSIKYQLINTETETALAKGLLVSILPKPSQEQNLVDIFRFLSVQQGAPKILVVDDSREARELYTRLAQEAIPDPHIVQADNGVTALGILSNMVPNLVILDLMMPEMDGYEVLEVIRSRTETKQVPVIIMSGKQLTFEDVQRLDFAGVTFQTKNMLYDHEIMRFCSVDSLETKTFPNPPVDWSNTPWQLCIRTMLNRCHGHAYVVEVRSWDNFGNVTKVYPRREATVAGSGTTRIDFVMGGAPALLPDPADISVMTIGPYGTYRTVFLDVSSGPAVTWSASVSQAVNWLYLGSSGTRHQTSGQTGVDVLWLQFHPEKVGNGTHSTSVTVTSANASSIQIEVTLIRTANGYNIFLPIINR